MAQLLGIDAGTTSVKAALFDTDGRCLAVGREEYTLDTPAPERVELDPEVYWSACVRAVRSVLAHPQAQPGNLRGLAVSSQGETTIPLGRDGRPVGPAIVWLDNRATIEAESLATRFGPAVYDRTGLPDVSPTWSACKILWLKNHQPEIFDAAEKFLLVQDWLVYRLAGCLVTEGSIACSTLLYDIGRDVWWDEMLEAVGLTADRLCKISQPGGVAGELGAQAAATLGLPPGIPVVMAGMDQAAGAIGAGNIAPGTVSETTGAALALQVSVPRADIDPQRLIPVNKHSVPGVFLCAPFCPTAGITFKWFRDVFCESETTAALAQGRDPYDLLTGLAAQVPPGADSLLMLPHLSGSFSPVYNVHARGVFSGFSLGHRKGHFVRAILEGVAFMLRRNLDAVAQAGLAAGEIRSSGGGARSSLWNQIKADICGLPVISLASEEAALLGDVILAGVAAGEFASLSAGCQRMVALRGRTDPGPDSPVYQSLYRRYCELDGALDLYYRGKPPD